MSFSDFSILAHRGCSSLAPENTHASFVAAHQQGATGVELDISMLGDGTPVVFHDDTVDRCSNRVGSLQVFTLDSIKKIDCGSWFSREFKGERVLTLDEVLMLLTELKLDLNLEIKPHTGGEKHIVDKVHNVLTRYSNFTPENLLFSSFDYTTLKFAREFFPNASLAILYEKALPEDWLEQAMRIQAKAINLNVEFASESVISGVRQAGLQVYVWTVNNYKRGRQLADMGVNGIITDRPQDFKHMV